MSHAFGACFATTFLAVQQESKRAGQEAEKAQNALQQAEDARLDAAQKRDSLLQVASSLEQMGKVIGVALERMSLEIGNARRGAVEQTNKIAETSVAMNQMFAAVSEVAKSVETASIVSTQTREMAKNLHVNGIAVKTSGAMDEAFEAFSELTSQSRGLGELIGKMC